MTTDIRIEVDQCLAAAKTLQGEVNWVRSHDPGSLSCKRSLLEGGVFRGNHLVVVTFPSTRPREFRLLINFGRNCVERYDHIYTQDGPHLNDFDKPMGYPSTHIFGPHLHPWVGNRKLATSKELPDNLLYAHQIENKINDLDQAFWWFCDKLSIQATTADVPEWPKPTQLL